MTKLANLTALIAAAACAAYAHLTPNSLSPSGGQTVKVGDEVTISWDEAVHHAGTTDINYSTDGGKTWAGVVKLNFADAEGPNSVKWTIPAEAATTQGKIRICQKAGSTCTDANNVSRPGTSAPYVLVSGNITVNAGAGVLPQAGAAALDLRFDPVSRNLEVSLELASPGRVKLEAFDSRGELVATLLDAVQPAGVRRLSVFSNRLDVARPLVFKLDAAGAVRSLLWNGAP